jgi:hypothetical protein
VSADDNRKRRLRYTRVEVVAGRTEARAVCSSDPSVLAIVDRHGPRSLVFSCPCGCGDIISINVDPGAGKAWRLVNGFPGVSLMPSVWRTTGCHSHFILWRSRIWWCTYDDEDDWPSEMGEELRQEWLAIRKGTRN